MVGFAPCIACALQTRSIDGYLAFSTGDMYSQTPLITLRGGSSGKRVGSSCGQSTPTLTIVTPVGKATEKVLSILEETLRWETCLQWIIVYDTKNQDNLSPNFANNKQVKEIYFHAEGISGNSQRNRGIEEITQGLVYFLDDDNVMHPHFWDIFPNMSLGHITTFDQARSTIEVLAGNDVSVMHIDTAMFVVDRALIGNSRFKVEEYVADGLFAQEIFEKHPGRHVYIPEVAAYYNYVKESFTL